MKAFRRTRGTDARRPPIKRVLLLRESYARLLREVVIVPHEDELVVSGLPFTMVLKGNSIHNVLPVLAPLLDGRRSVASVIAAAKDFDETAIMATLRRVVGAGLVTLSEKPFLEPSDEDLGIAAYLSRMATSVPVSADPIRGLSDLHEVPLLIICPPGQGSRVLHSTIRAIGFLNACFTSFAGVEEQVASVTSGENQPLVVVFHCGEYSHEQLQALDDFCAAQNLRWLHARAARNQCLIGPLFSRSLLPCYECFREAFRGFADREDATEVSVPSMALCAATLAIELVHLIAGVGRLFTGDGYAVMAPDGLLHERGRVPMRLVCARCQQYEALMQTLPAPVAPVSWFDQKVQTMHNDWASRAVPHPMADPPVVMESRVFSNSQRIRLTRRLPELRDGLLGLLYRRFPRGRAPSLSDLASLLILSAGVRPQRSHTNGQVKRWCASGGNLGSVQPCLVVRDIEGLDRGVYLYNTEQHELIVGDAQIEIPSVLHRFTGSRKEALPSALVVLVGCFGRVRPKYGDFGYRLMHFDAGTAAAQLHAAAAAMGLVLQTETVWESAELSQALRLGEQEELTQVLSLWREEAVPHAEFASTASYRPPLAETAEPSPRMSSSELLAVLRASPALETLARGFLIIDAAEAHEGINLPPAIVLGKSIGEVLRRRRSVRKFASAPVSLAELSSMLNAAICGEAEDWPAPEEGRSILRCHVLARNVSGLIPGVYRYIPRRHALTWSRPLPADDKFKELLVQEEFAPAPLMLWIEGDLASAAARAGFIGYGQMLVRAGSFAHRLWLAAMAVGIEGVLVAGVVHGFARQHLNLGSGGYSSMLIFVAGRSDVEDAIHVSLEDTHNHEGVTNLG